MIFSMSTLNLVRQLRWSPRGEAKVSVKANDYTVYARIYKLFDTERAIEHLGSIFHADDKPRTAKCFSLVKYGLVHTDGEWLLPYSSIKYVAAKLKAIAAGKKFWWGTSISIVKDNIEFYCEEHDFEAGSVLPNSTPKAAIKSHLNSCIAVALKRAAERENQIFKKGYDWRNSNEWY